MCDYSLEHYQSRPARKGEEYGAALQSGSIGFIEPGNHSVAVCMSCDTRLALSNIPEPVQARMAISAAESATFTRLDAGLYRDGVRFDNGRACSPSGTRRRRQGHHRRCAGNARTVQEGRRVRGVV